MKLQVISSVLLLSLSQLSFSATAKPEACPSVAGLKAVGVNNITQHANSWFGSVNSVNYSTNENWTFVIGSFKAKNDKKAKAKMMKSLKTMTLAHGPDPFTIEGRESWVCTYADQSGHHAMTITPTFDFTSTFELFK